MKKLTDKTRYTLDGHVATIYALPKAGPLKWKAAFTCHVATLEEIRKKGFTACLSLLHVIP